MNGGCGTEIIVRHVTRIKQQRDLLSDESLVGICSYYYCSGAEYRSRDGLIFEAIKPSRSK
jgi:hypothetical protein